MIVYSSITLNYVPKVRVLAHSVKRQHPDWEFHVIISDRLSENINLDLENDIFDRIIWIDQLPVDSVYAWIFKHNVVEICTAVKGMYGVQLLEEGVDKVIYLDPDIAVFNPLDEIEQILDDHPVILTPHIAHIETDYQAIMDNEIGPLKWGIFNLGFVAFNSSSEGRRFAQWWSDRLREFCYDDLANGLFTDQKWCNHVPVFFENTYILRNPGYNVASWNLSGRHLAFNDKGDLLVNGSLFRFYHFTGFDSGAGRMMSSRYANENIIVDEIWMWYGQQLKKYGHYDYGTIPWHYGYYKNGEKIPREARLLFRNRIDLQQAFPNPFDSDDTSGFYAWYKKHGQESN